MNSPFVEFLKLFSKEFGKNKKYIVAVCTLVVLAAGIGAIAPFIYGKTIDSITQRKYEIALGLVGVGVIIDILKTYFNSFNGKITAELIIKISNSIRCILSEKVYRMKVECFDKYSKGEIVNRIQESTEDVVGFYIEFFKNLTMLGINLFVPLFFMFFISMKLSMFTLLTMPIIFAIVLLFQTKIKKIQEELVKNQDEYTSYLYESLDNIDGIKAYQIEGKAVLKIKKLLNNIASIFNSHLKISLVIKVIQDHLIAIFDAMILVISINSISNGTLTIGEMISFIVYLDILMGAISSLSSLSISYKENHVNIMRIIEIEKVSLEAKGEDIGLNTIKKIEFVNLRFGYEKEKELLKNITFKIEKPGLYVIVGENGCGKSTILKLLLKFYYCHSEELFINDKDINDIGSGELRNEISYLSKNNFVMRASIYENIKMVVEHATDQEIWQALCTVGLKNFILSLDKGYNTEIGDGALTLSSGQIQKLMLARIILKKSSLILLDEVTSDLDPVSESEIIKIIKELAKTKIVISVAHRTQFVNSGDFIIHIHNGTMVDIGKHEELMLHSALYKEMFGEL